MESTRTAPQNTPLLLQPVGWGGGDPRPEAETHSSPQLQQPRRQGMTQPPPELLSHHWPWDEHGCLKSSFVSDAGSCDDVSPCLAAPHQAVSTQLRSCFTNSGQLLLLLRQQSCSTGAPTAQPAGWSPCPPLTLHPKRETISKGH